MQSVESQVEAESPRMAWNDHTGHDDVDDILDAKVELVSPSFWRKDVRDTANDTILDIAPRSDLPSVGKETALIGEGSKLSPYAEGKDAKSSVSQSLQDEKTWKKQIVSSEDEKHETMEGGSEEVATPTTSLQRSRTRRSDDLAAAKAAASKSIYQSTAEQYVYSSSNEEKKETKDDDPDAMCPRTSLRRGRTRRNQDLAAAKAAVANSMSQVTAGQYAYSSSNEEKQGIKDDDPDLCLKASLRSERTQHNQE